MENEKFYRVWGGNIKQKNAIIVSAKDGDDALKYVREKYDSNACAFQRTNGVIVKTK